MTNLEKIFLQANNIEIENGLQWYQQAHNVVANIAEKYNITKSIAIAVCSVLSPRCTWQQNIVDTEKFLRAFKDKHKIPNAVTYSHNRIKAWKILQTQNIDVFKTCKTYNFFNNILNPLSYDYITIDGHAINAYRGCLGKVKNNDFNKKNYNKIAKQYKKLAKKYNLLPNQFQAIVWLTFKRIYNIRVNWRDYQGKLPF